MIHEIRITNPSRSSVPWWSKVPWLQGKDKIEFKPGLNIIYGPNGSGKSTVLTLIARMLCCEQGDVQSIGDWSTRDLYDRSKKFLDGVLPIHDGAPIMHYDPSKTVGLFGGSFDYDFMDQGVVNACYKGSTGQTGIVRMARHLDALFKGQWPKGVEYKGVCSAKNLKKSKPELAGFLRGNLSRGMEATGIPTMLLDEPSRSLDLRTEIKFLERLADLKGVQIIMASHSTIALNLPGAHYIETSANYVDTARFDVTYHIMNSLVRDPSLFEFWVRETRKRMGDPK